MTVRAIMTKRLEQIKAIDELNGCIDTKNAVMLAVLGLHETLELMVPRVNDHNYHVEIINDAAHFCFSDDYKWSIKQMLEQRQSNTILEANHILDILNWQGAVVKYVD